MTGYIQRFVSKMEDAELAPAVIDAFSNYYRQLADGATGLISNRDILPVAPHEIKCADSLAEYVPAGKSFLKKAVMIVLNGGLGTSMGLSKAKSLLQVKDGFTFLEIKLRQAAFSGVRLALMNSFNTHSDTLDAVAKINPVIQPAYFLQNKFPKVLRDDLAPAHWPKDPALEWNPPGHGDLYVALMASGLLNRLLDNGTEFAFVANSDNLGATLDPALLGYFAGNGFPFMMEVAERTPADIKGGHLARHRNGRLLLRELVQCPEDEIDAFQDIRHFRFFNTNNIWINLIRLYEAQQSGHLSLPMMINPKTLDPRDATSPGVYQIETAMGAAISSFQNATAVKVPLNRFHPVKKCNDLLAVRSDCYRLTRDSRLRFVRNYDRPIKIFLDPAFYGRIDAFETRFQQGIPSLVDCDSLTVKGDVFFDKNIRIRGDVTIENRSGRPFHIKAGSLLDRSLTI